MTDLLQVAGSLSGQQGGPSTATLGLNGVLGGDLLGVDVYLSDTERREFARRGIGLFPAVRPVRLQFSPKLLRELWRRSGSTRGVIFHGLLLPNTLVGALLCRLRGTSYAIQLHGGLEPYQRQRHRGRKVLAGPLLRSVSRHAALIACASESEAVAARSYIGSSNVHTVGIGVPQPSGEMSARSLGPGTVRIGYLGRLAKKKRLDLVVGGCAQRSGSVHLVIAGAPGEVSAQQLAAWLDQAPALTATVLGPVSGVTKDAYWGKIDVLLLPSDNENFGIVVAEAAAQGIPVIATRHVAAQHDLVAHGGGVFCEQDTGSIARAIDELSEPGRYAAASRAARTAAAEVYSWESVAARWMFCLEAAGERSTRFG